MAKPKQEFVQQLRSHFDGLKFRYELFQENKLATDRFLATDFNVFAYIQPDEPKLSHIIGDLLNPKGGHGQSTVFLSKFLEILRPASDSDKADVDMPRQALMSALRGPIDRVQVDVGRERPTDRIERSQRRMDITVTINGGALAIENKPWSGDPESQLEDIGRHLEKGYKGKYVLVYLSGDDIRPPKSSLSPQRRNELRRMGHYFEISYPKEFRAWLECCRKECEAENVRSFLRDFGDYVEQNFRFALQEDRDD